MKSNLFHPYVCAACGHTSFHPEHSSGCGYAILIMLAFLGLAWWFNNALMTAILIIGVLLGIGQIFYLYCSKYRCHSCGNKEIVPVFSARGESILNEHNHNL